MKTLTRTGLSILLLAFTFSLFPVECDNAYAGESKSVLKPFVDSNSLAGAVTLVANKDKVLAVETVGYADVGSRRPMLVDMLFWIASMTKPITGAALMILVDEGKVKLDDPVEKYLPEFKGMMVMGKDKTLVKPDRPITVRDVMNHTSGLDFRYPKEQPTIDVLPLAAAVKSYTESPLLTQPGTNYKYSNAGINTAGRIIEVVSGMPYEVFLEKRLFGPLGMKDTTFTPSAEQVKRLAKSYKPSKDKKGLEETTVTALKYPLEGSGRYPCPGGGLFSTAGDLGVFCQMLLRGGEYNGKRFLSESAVKEMSSRQTGKGIAQNWGVGWSLGDGTYGHGGAFATNMTIDTKRGLVTVFMVQHAGFPNDGGKSQGVFRKAAEDRFGAK